MQSLLQLAHTDFLKLLLVLIILFGTIAVFAACILSGRISQEEMHNDLIKKGQD